MERLQRMSALALAILATSGAWASSANASAHRPMPRYHPAEAGLAFGLNLMRGLPGANIVLSPDSIEAALAMTGVGAAGQTARQIAKVLRLRSPAAFEEVGLLQTRIAAASESGSDAPVLNIAGGLFVQEGFALEAPFTAGLTQAFGTTPQSVDFENDPAAAAGAINEWANLQTHGLIPKVVEELPPETVLALVNAIYLKAKWVSPFKADATSSAPFYGKEGASTPFMHETEELPYSAGHGYALVELPYAASSLSLAIVLPRGESVHALQSGLTAPSLDRMLARAQARNVEVSLPKFDIGVHLELSAELRALGMTDAFAAADFTRIAAAPPLRLGQVLHAADIDVYEEGTEAAAVTVGEVEATSERLYPHLVVFDANHPFLFFLRDRHSGAILFEGRVEEPSTG